MPLDEKTKELVALGASLAGNCLPCLRYHYKKCRELGINVDDLDEVLDMAKTVKEVPIKKIYQLATLYIRRRKTPIFKSGCKAPLSINPEHTPGFSPGSLLG